VPVPLSLSNTGKLQNVAGAPAPPAGQLLHVLVHVLVE